MGELRRIVIDGQAPPRRETDPPDIVGRERTRDAVPVAPILALYERFHRLDGVQYADVARRLGWLTPNERHPDIRRVRQVLGSRTTTHRGKTWRQTHVTRTRAADLILAITGITGETIPWE